MKVSNLGVPVYTVAGSGTARPLPDWLIRKRKRSLKQDPEFANRVELLQDFEFEEASSCVRVSEDGDWLMSTGTYKPQIHMHYLPHLALSYAHHTKALNETFILLASDATKSLHLQTDRFLEFHTRGSLHYTTRIPRYGRDLVYDRQSAEVLIPSVGVNVEGNGEVFRLNLEVGRFMKAYEVDVGGDDTTTVGAGSLQGGIHTGAVNTGSVAEDSHNLLAFGTSLGTVEFWDSRSRNRVATLSSPQSSSFEGRPEVTALQFHRSGLEIATGHSDGLIYLYDMRSPVPLLKKDQGYGFKIKNLIYLDSGASTRAQTSEPKILSADKRIIKIWDRRDGTPWTSVEPAVDLNHVEWCKDSGMLLTANEGKQQHAFFIPQLGPAPKWCTFLDNLVEEMAEDPDDPNAFGNHSAGEVYDNFKFLTVPQLKQLSLDHLIGTTSLLRPYMHGYFVAQKLYEEARLISNPNLWQEQRAKSIQEKIEKERESRIRGSKKVAAVKVNRRLAEKILEREEKNERRRAKRVLERGGDEDMLAEAIKKPLATANGDADGDVDMEDKSTAAPLNTAGAVLHDPRFARLFQDEDFEVNEQSREFRDLNPSTNTTKLPKGLTAVEQEELDSVKGSSDEESASDDETERTLPVRNAQKQRDGGEDKNRISSSSYKKNNAQRKQLGQNGPMMQASSSSNTRPFERNRDKTFGARVKGLHDSSASRRRDGPAKTVVVGEREITFAPEGKQKKHRVRFGDGGGEEGNGVGVGEENGRAERKKGFKDRRSASGNVFRRM